MVCSFAFHVSNFFVKENNAARAQEILSNFKNKNVLIIGDVMIDCYWRGNVKRISPEAPVPIFDLVSAENRLGGAANVALNIKSLGANPVLVSVIGNDANAETFENLLRFAKIDEKFILRDSKRPTTVKTRVVAGSQQMLRIDAEVTADIETKMEARLIEAIKTVLMENKIDVVIIQDYNKGVLTQSVIKKIISSAQAKNIPIAVDPKNKNFWNYKNVTLFKPNLKEISDALQHKVNPIIAELDAATLILKQKLQAEQILITLSEKGLYYNSDSLGKIYPITPRHISDVSGAGDTVISVVALCLATKVDSKALAQLANLSGGIVCEYAGVVPINFDQLLIEFSKTNN